MSPSEDAAVEENGGRSSSARNWSTVVGFAVGLAGLAFVAGAVVRDWDEVSAAIQRASIGLLVLAMALAALGMTGIGLAWYTSLRILGARLSVLSSLRGYFVGQLGKYLPGGVWAIMGRGEWARGGGIPGALAYTSVLLSMGSAYLAALTLAVILLPLPGSVASSGSSRFLLVLLLLPLGYLLLHPRVLEWLLAVTRRVTTRDLELAVPPWRRSVLIVLQQLPSWLAIGGVTIAVVAALGARGNPLNLVWATAVAWIVGFVALPTPGGIGVREAVFVALATSIPAGIGAAVAVIARLVFISADVLGAAITSLVVSERKRRTGAEP